MSTIQTPPARTSGAAALSLAFGLLALVLSGFQGLGLAAFPLGFFAVAAALWGLRSIRRFGMAGGGLVIAGLVTGVISLIVAFNTFRVYVDSLRSPQFREDLNQMEQFLQGDSG